MLDFPASPTNGQKFPQPAVAGVPVYTWDGEKWTTAGGEIVTATPATALPLINATPAVVGVTLKYAREDHVHPTDTTRAPAADVTNSFASSLAYSGMQINGGMEVSQERGNTPTSTNGAYLGDIWKHFFNGTMVVSGNAASPPTGLFTGYGFPSQLQLVTTTAQASLGAGNYDVINHYIEGYRVARLMWGKASAQPITISFWTAHTRTGIYSVTVRNGARSFAFTYTQNISEIAQFNTVTVPGDTTGTWATDNTAGIILTFANACGITSIAPSANTWLAADYLAAPGQVNGVAATTDNFRLTGVTVLPGTQAPTAAQSPNIMRPYGEELATCQRYWEKRVLHMEFATPVSGGSNGVPIQFSVSKRAIPTITGPTPAAGGAGANYTTATIVRPSTNGCEFILGGVSSNVQVYLVDHYFVADARL